MPTATQVKGKQAGASQGRNTGLQSEQEASAQSEQDSFEQNAPDSIVASGQDSTARRGQVCDTQSKKDSDTQSGDVLNETYLLLRPLDSREHGRTYLAKSLKDGQQYVIKALSWKSMRDMSELEMFRREYDILKTLDHPGIPKVYEMFEQDWGGDKHHFLVMQHIAGKSLQQMIDEKQRLTEEQARVLLNSLIDTLSYLHGLSPMVLHRDIKPSNIIIGPDGGPVLIDFDTARGQGVDMKMGDGTMIGTPGYVPFEQLYGKPEPASDIYALGMTMIVLLSHRHPSTIPFEKMRLQFEDFLNVSESLKLVLAVMVHPEVASRYQNVSDVREALQARYVTSGRPRAGAKRKNGLTINNDEAFFKELDAQELQVKEWLEQWLETEQVIVLLKSHYHGAEPSADKIEAAMAGKTLEFKALCDMARRAIKAKAAGICENVFDSQLHQIIRHVVFSVCRNNEKYLD